MQSHKKIFIAYVINWATFESPNSNNMKTIVEQLNDAGYKNTDTKRQRAVRNLNMLIEAGILELKFVHADKYNSEKNTSFWMKCTDGKERPTAYKVTLYGKTYYGHIMYRKMKSTSVVFGEKVENIECLNNTTISVEDIQLRVAQLLNIIRTGGDFFAPKVFAKYGECSCKKCNGQGIIQAFMYYANGICFDCGGSGIDRNVLKSFIKNSITI